MVQQTQDKKAWPQAIKHQKHSLSDQINPAVNGENK